MAINSESPFDEKGEWKNGVNSEHSVYIQWRKEMEDWREANPCPFEDYQGGSEAEWDIIICVPGGCVADGDWDEPEKVAFHKVREAMDTDAALRETLTKYGIECHEIGLWMLSKWW